MVLVKQVSLLLSLDLVFCLFVTFQSAFGGCTIEVNCLARSGVTRLIKNFVLLSKTSNVSSLSYLCRFSVDLLFQSIFKTFSLLINN